MATNNRYKTKNPMSEYLLKLQMIVTNSEFMNLSEANKYETLETKINGRKYVNAVLKTDIFESYQYDRNHLIDVLLASGISEERAFFYAVGNGNGSNGNPSLIPQTIKNKLLEESRREIISSYIEPNKYYINLSGKPFMGNENIQADEIFLIPDEFYQLYEYDAVIQRNEPIHEMPLKYQELFMNSKYYEQLLKDHPEATYLRYIGSNSIPIEISRLAKDGDILKINTSKLSVYNETFGNVVVSPELIHLFTRIYKETRDYVYQTLKGNFSAIYANYDSFIRFLTIYLSIGNTMNELMKQSTSMLHMNNATANDFFMLYGLPSVIMEGKSMIDFLKKFRLILQDKGTNVVYRVKDLIGYQYTDIYTLIMVKQQRFKDGIPLYDYETGKPVCDIVFRRLGTTDDNTSYFKFKEPDREYSLDEIRDGDPRWWNDPEVDRMLYDMNYTLSNSKYIQLSTHLSMTDIYWQSTILIRGLLDRYTETNFTKFDIGYSINGTSVMTVFEAVLILTILMDWQLSYSPKNPLYGNMYIPNGVYNGQYACLDLLFNGLNDDGSPCQLKLGSPFKISSFNFDIKNIYPDFYNNELPSYDYLQPDKFIPMLDKIINREYTNVGEVLMTDVKLLYKYLETKLRESNTIYQFRQVTETFKHLFLVDPYRKWYDDRIFDTDTIICDKYNITLNELSGLKTVFIDQAADITITYNNIQYPISLYQVLNTDVPSIKINDIYPFTIPEFVTLFKLELKTYESERIRSTSNISNNIKNNGVYKDIISDKVDLDISSTEFGPKTFEGLLLRINPSLSKAISDIKNKPDSLLLLIRSIIKALEEYTNSQLFALEFKAIGVDNYFKILKEVISYFKSYMVEFTKDEFVYILGGIFDNGGSSDMLKLFDEVSNVDIDILPTDSLTMFDISNAESYKKFEDGGLTTLFDESIIRVEGTYQSMLDSGYDIWYDDGTKITHTPYQIDPTSNVIANIVNSPNNDGYMLIINIDNIDVKSPYYYGTI